MSQEIYATTAAIPDTSRKPSAQFEHEEVNLDEARIGVSPERNGPHFILLSLGFGGLQTVFALLSSNGSSYLLSLGMDKSLLGITWLSGPIVGALLQPYVGVCSDRCYSSWGRRKPYILGGTLLIVFAMALLAQAAPTASAVACLLGTHAAERTLRMALAIFAVICITCGIQPVQVGLRALIVDKCRPSLQLSANAWAARVTGIGNIIGFLAGVVDLPRIFPVLNNQFTALSLFTGICLVLTTMITCVFIKEEPLPPPTSGRVRCSSAVHNLREIFRSARILPEDIRNVCIVQFFSWMGWFPFLFYISTYTSETYLKRFKNLVSNDRESVPRDLWDDATRQGSASMLVFAIVSLIASAFLPLMISGSKKASKTRRGSHLLHRIAPISLRNAWAISQLLFGLCLLVPAFFDEIAVIMVFVGFIGISWACTIWIPFALITTSISARNSRSYMDTVEGPQKLEAATVLALHNVAICVPQALTACLSSIIFWLSGGQENSIPLVLGFGSLAGFGAAWATRKFKTDTTLESNGVDESIAFASDTTTKPHDDDDDYE